VSYNFSAIFVCISNEPYSHLSTGFGISTEPQMPIDLANNKIERSGVFGGHPALIASLAAVENGKTGEENNS